MIDGVLYLLARTAGIPTKWIDPDGLGLHLVFSGNDCFFVRGGTLSVD